MRQVIFNYYVIEIVIYLFIYSGDKDKNAVTLPHSAHRIHAFWGKIKSEADKIAPRKKVAFELLHHRLGHISTR